MLADMVSTFPPIPPADDLFALSRAALENAADLLADAEILAARERYPRAYALATLAWEELSKADHCIVAAANTAMTPDRFWTAFRSHEDKLSAAHGHAEYLRPEPIGSVTEHYRAMVSGSRSTQKQKERAFYVEYKRGKVLVPSQIGQRAAQGQIRAVKKVLEKAEKYDPKVRDVAWALVSEAVHKAQDADNEAFRAAFQIGQRDGDWNPLITLIIPAFSPDPGVVHEFMALVGQEE